MRSSMASSIGNQNMPRVEPVQVIVNNNSSAVIKQRQDGRKMFLEIEEAMAETVVRGGGPLDRAMSRAFGVRRQGY
jgi:hypothetical protein